MATSPKKFVVGIDIGSHITRVVVAEESLKPGIPPKILGIGYSESSGVHQGYIVSPRDAQNAFTEALRMAEKTTGVEIKRAYVAISGISLTSEIMSSAVSIARPDGEVTEEDIYNAMTLAEESFTKNKRNLKTLHTIPLKYRLDGYEVFGSPLGMRGSRLELKSIFITVSERHFNDLISVITESGVDIIDIIAAPIAESLAVLTKKQKMVGCALVTIGSETVSLTVFDNDTPVSVVVFPIGSNDITNDIALGMRISLDEAELIKIGSIESGKYPKKKIDEIIEARLSDIFELVQNHLRSIKRDGLLPAGIVISGGGSMLHKIDEFAKDTLKLPAATVRTETIINTRRDLDPSWLAVYGLCFLEDDNYSYSTKFLKTAFKETKNGLMKFLREFLP